MKQTARSERKDTQTVRAKPPQASSVRGVFAPRSHLTQLASAFQSSPRLHAEAQLQADVHESPRLQGLRDLVAVSKSAQRAGPAAPASNIQAPVQRRAQAEAAPIQLQIDPNKQEYADHGQRVTHQKHGRGTILAIAGTRYRVKFLGNDEPIEVSAEDLDLGKDEEHELKGSEEDETPSPVAAAASGPSTASPGFFIVLKKIKPKKWDVTFEDEINGITVTRSDVGESEIKPLLSGSNKITETTQQVKSGRIRALNQPSLRGAWKTFYESATERRKQQKLAEQEAEEYVASRRGGEKRSEKGLPSQREFMERLSDLHNARRSTEPGHATVPMTKIKLRQAILLRVGGESHNITHLYTQSGNSSADGKEIRCYLGTEAGAYQRVHTSLTAKRGEPFTSHTMVQTGEKVVVPRYGKLGVKGKRVGYDQEEGGQSGFAKRSLLKIRTKKQTEGEFLDAVDLESLSEDQKAACRMLARRFNEALDQVSADIIYGDVGGREVTHAGAKFTILDDSWLFAGGKPATPDAEWEHEKGRMGEPRRQREPFRALSADEYEERISVIRGTIPGFAEEGKGLVDLPQGRGKVYPHYPLSPEQIAALGGREIIPTVPDGDCSINAVLESAGLEDRLNEIRAQLAEGARGQHGMKTKEAAKILQPGDWSHSDQMLPLLAELLKIRILVIQANGQQLPIGGEDAERGTVQIFHVAGAIGHYYGSRD